MIEDKEKNGKQQSLEDVELEITASLTRKTSFKEKLYRVILPVVGFVGLGFLGGMLLEYSRSNTIPKENNVKQGCVIPSKLEILTKDLDENGKKEVIMKYGQKTYLMKHDENGNPTIIPYKVVVTTG
ncbi:hypothetical protein KY311_02030 [Candidatus Woesearchaeota archaeon]|nr:hypothetical protein [Candidatus Woesearchaeota archaeon]